MPWKECNRVDEKMKFIVRLIEGEKMAVLCRQFGISRKTVLQNKAKIRRCRYQCYRESKPKTFKTSK